MTMQRDEAVRVLTYIARWGGTTEREALTLAIEALSAPEGWRPIETAPRMRPVFVAYRNRLDKWRRVVAQFYEAQTLEIDEANYDYESDDGWAEPGWYELSETHGVINRTDAPPLLWHPLPAIPKDSP